jgi:hypothetical protein
MEKRQLKRKRRQQHYTDCVRGVKSKSRRANNEDNLSQTQAKAKEFLIQSKETT